MHGTDLLILLVFLYVFDLFVVDRNCESSEALREGASERPSAQHQPLQTSVGDGSRRGRHQPNSDGRPHARSRPTAETGSRPARPRPKVQKQSKETDW